MDEYIFTFGYGQGHDGGYVTVIDDNYESARKLMNDQYGDRWAFQYEPPNAKEKAGVEKYGLYEVNFIVK